ncbi:hypothetical protein AB4369_03140 [Vibrio sp. 10N.261.49.A5]|uniref:Uncharacterized protein n=1 Tax=Vibrio tasmaniensis 1F-267 TaxID=1191324 RepID=A0ABX3B325_9VIBR|nr:hypothetical protein [Vibrio tasmaniensis]OEF44707.1 hypothetical protein A163_10885 [Vibrio tasmaniensis 1F-267]
MDTFKNIEEDDFGNITYECPNCKDTMSELLLEKKLSKSSTCKFKANCLYCKVSSCLEPRDLNDPSQENTFFTNPDEQKSLDELEAEIQQGIQSSEEDQTIEPSKPGKKNKPGGL